MTESQARRLEGKKVRLKVDEVAHSIYYLIYEGTVRIEDNPVVTNRGSYCITKWHANIYLDNAKLVGSNRPGFKNEVDLPNPEHFDFRRIKIIQDWEILK